MQLTNFIEKNKKVLILFSVLFLIGYGCIQIQIVDVIQTICFTELEGFAYIAVVFSKFVTFFSGFFTVIFVIFLTNILYEIFFCVDVNKIHLFILSSFGFLIYFLLSVIISMLIRNLNSDFLLNIVSIDNLKENKNYLWIYKLKNLNTGIYFIYLSVGMHFLVKESWVITVKYAFALLCIFIVQVVAK